jgi:hypothetical protein
MSLLRASDQYLTLRATPLTQATNNKFVTGISKNLGRFNATSDAELEQS